MGERCWIRHPTCASARFYIAATGYQKLKITGKSQQGDNKWIRFNKNLTVSSDYDLNQTHLESLKSLQMKNQKDQNSGQDSAAQEVPLKTEIEGQERGNTEGKTNVFKNLNCQMVRLG
uniref:Uncharacterized protein n=1 Tax=Salix viminalis TaxID=40686 RepID=A0A6N2L854_SALVM